MRNKSPTMNEPWDSRFTECVCERLYEEFRTKYLAEVEPVLEIESTRLQVLKDNGISAVSDSWRLLANINDDVLKNGTSNEKFELVTTLYRQLAESEATEMATDARLESYHSYMEETR